MAVDVFARTLALASLGNGGGGSAVDTYTKAEINKMFSEAGTVQVEAVDALPTEDIKENVIYLVPNGSSGENFYDECMYINNKWEIIGTTEVDLSNYVTKEELETALADKITQDVLAAYATKTYVDDFVEKHNLEDYHIIIYGNDRDPSEGKYGMVEFANEKLLPALQKVSYLDIIVLATDISRTAAGGEAAYGMYYITEYIEGSKIVLTDAYFRTYKTAHLNSYDELKFQKLRITITIEDGVAVSQSTTATNFDEISSLSTTKNYQTPYVPRYEGSPATKKYVDDSVAAIEIPSIEGLATEEYADAAGQKAFDDMAAIAGDVNSLTTETHETFAAAINEINAKVDSIGNQIIISSIEPLDATKDPNLINNYITQEELKEFHTRILNGGSGKIIFQGSVEDVTYVSHYVPQYPSPSMFFYCVNNYIGTPSTKDGATVYKEKYAPAFVLIYTEQTDTYSWGRTSQTSIEVPSVEGLATEEYVNNQIATVSGNGINCYDIKTKLYTSLDGEPVGTQITDTEDIAVLETIINNQVPNTEIFLINNTEARNENTYLATMTYKEDNYCEINISSTLLWLGSVTGNLQIDYEEVDGQLKITNAIAGVYQFGYEISSNYYNKDEVAEQMETKQNVLTAGEGISIVNNVISATSSGESSVAVFEGTQEEYDALSDEEKTKYTIAVIDDGEEV